MLADLLAAEGNADQLSDRLTEMWEQQPKNVFLAYFLAAQYVESKQFDKAAELYRKALEEQPSVDAYQGLTKCYLQLQDDERLLEILGRSVSDLNGLGQVEAEIEPLTKDLERIGRLAEIGRQRFGEDPNDKLRAEAIAVSDSGGQSRTIRIGRRVLSSCCRKGTSSRCADLDRLGPRNAAC